MPCVAEKVVALIVREAPHAREGSHVLDAPAGHEVLLFRHPTAGVQVPAGTMEEGEEPEAAALREGQEESGLSSLAILRYLGTQETVLPEGRAVMARTATVYSRPDDTSWDWASVRRGLGVDVLRRAGEWVQVDFRESNRFPDPEWDTFRIIGWVPDDVLCTAVRRHIYLLTPTAPTPDAEWSVEIDNHVFRPFWASVDEIVATGAAVVVEPQRPWLDYLPDIANARPLQPGPHGPLP